MSSTSVWYICKTIIPQHYPNTKDIKDTKDTKDTNICIQKNHKKLFCKKILCESYDTQIFSNVSTEIYTTFKKFQKLNNTKLEL